jgi:geranylgeranylglycerol-phosphate geranylgeranyltransferase
MESRNLDVERVHGAGSEVLRMLEGYGGSGSPDLQALGNEYRDALFQIEEYIYSYRERFLDVLRIMMPNRAFATCVAFMDGMSMGGHFDAGTAVFGSFMILSTYCSQAVFNNIRDIEGDKVNAPSRPLASGSLSVGFAWSLMGTLILLGFLFAYLASPFLVLVNMLYIAIGLVYSTVSKSRWHLAYVTLATSHIVVPIVSGYLVFGHLDARIALIAGFMYLTQSVVWSIKDYKDIEGDRKTGVMTLPVVMDPKDASKVTALVLSLPLAFFWVPWYFLHLSYVFLGLYLASGIARFVLGTRLMADHSPESASKILINFRYALLLEMVGWCLS